MAGQWYEDGFSTIIIASLIPNTKLYETEVTPPSIDTGEPIPQDTMRNIEWGMKAFQKLKDMTDGRVVFAFAPDSILDLKDTVGKNQQLRIVLPDTFSILFWGGYRNAIFSSFVKGTRPTMSCDVVCTNRDDNGVESGPTWDFFIL